MTVSAPRLDPRLRRAARRLDDDTESMAETWRKIGRHAEQIGCTRPGYDVIRVIVREHRSRRAELRELLEPVVADLLQGRVSAWDLERVIDAAKLAQISAQD